MRNHTNQAKPAHLIVINGASSSGGTSLVNGFCRRHSHYEAAHIDTFIETLPQEMWERCASSDAGWVEIGKAFNQYLLALTEAGKPVIADTFYKFPAAREHLFHIICRKNVFYVQLYCQLIELERRERERGNRKIGLARSQFDTVYSYQGYDLQIDSTFLTVEECVQLLEAHVDTAS